ncbi:hypothetical protein D3C85_1247330 [compost metagenome]
MVKIRLGHDHARGDILYRIKFFMNQFPLLLHDGLIIFNRILNASIGGNCIGNRGNKNDCDNHDCRHRQQQLDEERSVANEWKTRHIDLPFVVLAFSNTGG